MWFVFVSYHYWRQNEAMSAKMAVFLPWTPTFLWKQGEFLGGRVEACNPFVIGVHESPTRYITSVRMVIIIIFPLAISSKLYNIPNACHPPQIASLIHVIHLK